MEDIRYILENLFINNYNITHAKRISPLIFDIKMYKLDEFGSKSEYQFFFLNSAFQLKQVHSIRKNSQNCIVIGNTNQPGIDFTFDSFLEKLATQVNPGIYLRPDLIEVFEFLGHNQLPTGMTGKPEDLLEIYTKECLQFLFSGKGRRYGKERSFESLPDGVVLSDGICVMFDAKAYKDGYSPSADDLKRFTSYVNDFNRKYAILGGPIFSFVVVSGHFGVGEAALEDRAKELYETCQTTMSFISGKELAEFCTVGKQHIEYLPSINWKKILSKTAPKASHLLDQIKTNQKDKII